MSYEPTNWKAGDVVTSAKLNKIEHGITNNSRSILIINNNDGILDKTAEEIKTALESGTICYLLTSQDTDIRYEILTCLYSYENNGDVTYTFKFQEFDLYEFIAYSADKYPTRVYLG